MLIRGVEYQHGGISEKGIKGGSEHFELNEKVIRETRPRRYKVLYVGEDPQEGKGNPTVEKKSECLKTGYQGELQGGTPRRNRRRSGKLHSNSIRTNVMLEGNGAGQKKKGKNRRPRGVAERGQKETLQIFRLSKKKIKGIINFDVKEGKDLDLEANRSPANP